MTGDGSWTGLGSGMAAGSPAMVDERRLYSMAPAGEAPEGSAGGSCRWPRRPWSGRTSVHVTLAGSSTAGVIRRRCGDVPKRYWRSSLAIRVKINI